MVDCLDYSKGILYCFYGFVFFLEYYFEYYGKVILVMVIVFLCDYVGSYVELKIWIDEEIGFINGWYFIMNWILVCYFYYGFLFEELVVMYFIVDIVLVIFLCDGMNLVVKEYIVVK